MELGFNMVVPKRQICRGLFLLGRYIKTKKNYIQDVTADSFYEYQTKQAPGYILFSFKYNFNIELKNNANSLPRAEYLFSHLTLKSEGTIKVFVKNSTRNFELWEWRTIHCFLTI